MLFIVCVAAGVVNTRVIDNARYYSRAYKQGKGIFSWSPLGFLKSKNENKEKTTVNAHITKPKI